MVMLERWKSFEIMQVNNLIGSFSKTFLVIVLANGKIIIFNEVFTLLLENNAAHINHPFFNVWRKIIPGNP